VLATELELFLMYDLDLAFGRFVTERDEGGLDGTPTLVIALRALYT
jgi:hypothetical protein